ncbi:hypothetical protein [Armatimonas sp.]|uniref:hypothetical protein n=1 Tax=Armatimonas sp. TaxID=1872638 RepID=UPI00286ADC73|nr:hypothetical protein [Armatimonas sp.]
MRRGGFLQLLIACLVVFSTSVPSLASTISWFCDGRFCGALLCCCEQPDLSGADENCQKRESPGETRELCSSSCGCTPLLTNTHDLTSDLKPTLASLAPPEPSLAHAFGLVAPRTCVSLVSRCLPDYRGPPLLSLTLPSAEIRGPPPS